MRDKIWTTEGVQPTCLEGCAVGRGKGKIGNSTEMVATVPLNIPAWWRWVLCGRWHEIGMAGVALRGRGPGRWCVDFGVLGAPWEAVEVWKSRVVLVVMIRCPVC